MSPDTQSRRRSVPSNCRTRVTGAFVTAQYGGDARPTGSTSQALTQQVVSPAGTGTAPSDNFASRMPLSGMSVTTSGSNLKATRETGEPRHAGISGGKSVW